jgi:hypothetical protein
LGAGLSPVLQIFKPYDSRFGTLFQILLGTFQKPGLLPDLQYTLPQTEYTSKVLKQIQIRDYIGMEQHFLVATFYHLVYFFQK